MTEDSNLNSADKRLIIAALAVVLLLSALDQTIVSTAMPQIIEQLQGLKMYAWVTTSYMLTSTVSVPIYGKLSDLYGRKPILVWGIVLFLVGSTLCGMAGEFGSVPLLGDGMTQLIVFRAVQGLGGGALTTVVFAIIADLFAPRERGRLFGVFGSVFGLATMIGPFVGGYFTDHGATTLWGHEIAGWRWVFYVNLPLGLLALFMILYRLPTLRHRGTGQIDYPGAALLVLTFTPLLLALTLGGTTYPWSSSPIVGLLALGAVSLLLFLWVEARTTDALLPLHLFRVDTFRIAILAQFVLSTAFLGVVMFMPLYMQVVQGVTATHSGYSLLPLMIGIMISSIGCGRLAARTGRYKYFMVGGAIVLVIGVLLLTQIGPDTTTRDLAWRLAITGLGLGPAQTLFNLVVTNSVPLADRGVASSTSQFSRQIGSTVGVAFFGTLLTHGLTAELPRHVPQLPGAASTQFDLGRVQSQAMNVEHIRSQVDAVLAASYQLIQRAYRGDPTAQATVLGDERLPESVKAPLRAGGIRAQVHAELAAHAAAIQSQLQQGDAGRARLLIDPRITAAMKDDLANIPARALHDPQVMASLADLFGDSVLMQEEALVVARTDHALASARLAITAHADLLVEQIQRGMRAAFSVSITQMLASAAWIVVAGLLIVLFIPEIPLRSRTDDEPTTAVETRPTLDERVG